MFPRSQQGFTLLEILVSLAILGLLAAIIVPSFRNYRNMQVLNSETERIVLALREARSKTLSSVGFSSYGVHVEAGRVVQYAGAAYEDGAPDNSAIDLDPAVAISDISLLGGPDILFERLTGETGNSGTLTVSLVDGVRSKQVTITAAGLIEAN